MKFYLFYLIQMKNSVKSISSYKFKFWLLSVESNRVVHAIYMIIYYIFDILLKCIYSQTEYKILLTAFSVWIIQCAIDATFTKVF